MSDSPQTIPALLRAAAQQYGDKPAYVADGQATSFAALLESVRNTAGHLVSIGVQPGDCVAVWAPNSVDWVIAALAATYAGGTLVPLNSRYTAHEVADVLKRTLTRAVVVADGFLGKTQINDLIQTGTQAAVIDLAGLPHLAAHSSAEDRAEADRRAAALTGDDVADILFTSGTTGRSKGAMSAHRQTTGVARVWGELGGVNSADRYLVINPFFHSFGYKVGIITGLTTGATLYPLATFDLDQTMRLIEEEGITVLPGAPTIYQSLLNAPGREGRNLSSLRLAVTGAAVVPVALIEKMRAPAPAGLEIDQVVTAFGMTEAVVTTMCRQGDSAETVANTCGRAVPNMQIRIDGVEPTHPDAYDQAGWSAEGELLIQGDYVMLGYLDDPTATAEAIKDGWLHTGDVGKVDRAGNLKITDRIKDMYISGGFNVYPAEVEQALAHLDGVADAAVIGVPDERMGEIGKAFVVRAETPAGAALTAESVIAFAKERLANYKVPRLVTFSEPLPRNLGGKVLKNELRDAHAAESKQEN